MNLTEREKGHIEGYAAALADLEAQLTGYQRSAKNYDPMTVGDIGGEGVEKMHSYAFDMKDGGRHHELCQYRDVPDILHTLLQETLGSIKKDVVITERSDGT